MSIDGRGRTAAQRTVAIFETSTDVAHRYDDLVDRRRTQRRNHMLALVATVTVAVFAVLFVQSNLSADSKPQPMKPVPGLEIGDVPVWYDDVGLHYGDAVDQTAVPLTSKGGRAAFRLVRTGALYQDPRTREVWFQPWGGEPRVIGKDSGWWPSYGPAGDPDGDNAAWFEGEELVVYDTATARELARIRTARVSGPRAAEHLPWSNGFMQVSSDAVVWASDAEPDRVYRLDLQTQEITDINGPGGSWVERGFSVVQRLEDVHDEIELWSWGLGNVNGSGGLSISIPGGQILRYPDFEMGTGRISPDGRFLLGVTANHGTAFVNLANSASFLLPEQRKDSYPWIAWSYGSTALIIIDRGNIGNGIDDILMTCNPVDRECMRLPSTGSVVLPGS